MAAQKWQRVLRYAGHSERAEEVKVTFKRQSKKLVSLRLDEQTIRELKKIAEAKGIGYLELIRMWVLENLARHRAA